MKIRKLWTHKKFYNTSPDNGKASKLIEAKSLLWSGTTERCFILVGFGLTCNHYTRLEELARDKHSFLLQKFVNCGQKKSYSIGPGP
jgi:hypothetical protein